MPTSNVTKILDDLKIEFFADANLRRYAKVPVGKTRKILPLESQQFSEYIRRAVYQSDGTVLAEHKLKELVSLFSAKASYDGDARRVYIRTAPIDHADPLKGIEIDLGDEDGQCVRITADEFTVCQPSVEFLRPSNYLTLPIPAPGGDIRRIFDYVNVEGDSNQIALITFLIASLYPTGPYPMLVLTGQEGSGKSVATELIAKTIDPRTGTQRSMPQSERDIAIAAMRAHLLTYDNLSDLKWDVSDTLCRISTGATIEVRKLYSDADVFEMTFMKPLLLNSIIDLVSRPDLAQRTFILELTPITPSKRRLRSELEKTFADDSAHIFGGICRALHTAMAEYRKTKVLMPPRMADAAKIAAAASSSFNSTPNEVVKALNEVQNNQKKVLASEDAVCRAIKAFLRSQIWEGDATTLYGELTQQVNSALTPRPPNWPKDVATFSKHLKRQHENLKGIGIIVTNSRDSDGRKIKLEREAVKPTAAVQIYARTSVSACDSMTAMTADWDDLP
ncbi:MAG: hypothetical protein ACOZAA_02675 [Pseudomonadota bacterium]